jgi:hypothetical protein
MLTALSDFKWHVFTGGYTCQDVNGEEEGSKVVLPDVLENEGFLEARYPLEEEPGLYRRFAGLEPSEKAVLSFANEWGPLKNAHTFHDSGAEEEDEEAGEDGFAWTGDPLDFWYTQIRRMKALVDLWQILEDDEEKSLSDVINVKKDADTTLLDVQIHFPANQALFWTHTFHERDWPGYLGHLKRGGTKELARMCLLDLVNESLWGSCSPWLAVEGRPDAVTLRLSPHNLNAALWLMFAQEILGERTLKKCVYCKGFFEVASDGKERRQRSDKKYCSPRCRAAAFRERTEITPEA